MKDKAAAEAIELAEETLTDADEAGAAQSAERNYERARELLGAARKAMASGNSRKARKNAEAAYAASIQALELTQKAGEATVEVTIDPPGCAVHYCYNSYGDANHMHLVFDNDPAISRFMARGPVVSVETEGNTVDLVLGKRTYVADIRRDGDTIEIVAARRSAFWPVLVAILADSGVAYRMNRGDPFQLIDVLRFFPYISYIPRIFDGVKVGRGEVGIALKSPATGFKKTGELGVAQAQLTVRCRFQE